MVFGKKETYDDDLINYSENVDLILHNLRSMGHSNLTKEELNEILQNGFSIGAAVRLSLCDILNHKAGDKKLK